ncbi:hypothetical protein D4740_12660 [Actinomyces sp. 2119]|uniref:hypothetical protein n=1 Tax=Actinomyces sp. 2119 TaxID=2321393 RepID=UPI000E6B7EA1|nr:hypothetical protein [Actinomyces sp. 2119]RJF40055.1 hypothetical protein D4740_12660 [Actinomyces sp. 2119]
MLSVVVSVLVALVALVVVVAVVHRGSGPRTRLLQLAAASMLVSVLLREYEAVYGDQVVVDLVKRLVFLVTMVSVAVLVMTFRRGGLSRRAAWRVAGAGAVLGVVDCVAAAAMPLREGGLLYSYDQAGVSAWVGVYYGTYEVALAAMAVALGTGGVSALVRRGQPGAARVSLVLLVAAAGLTVVYAGVGVASLAGLVGPGGREVRHVLFLVVLVLIVVALAVGGVRRIVEEGRSVLVERVGEQVVEPLWREVTRVRPGVRLSVEGLSAGERVVRQVVETNDVLHLVRYGEAAAGVAEPAGPAGTAELVVGLVGPEAVPRPLGWWDRVLVGLGRVVLPRDEVSASLRELYELRLALAPYYPARTR